MIPSSLLPRPARSKNKTKISVQWPFCLFHTQNEERSTAKLTSMCLVLIFLCADICLKCHNHTLNIDKQLKVHDINKKYK